MAAPRYRDTTSKGQRLELAQFESAAVVMASLYLDLLASGAEQLPLGNAGVSVPLGCYRCAGDGVSSAAYWGWSERSLSVSLTQVCFASLRRAQLDTPVVRCYDDAA